MRGLGLWLLGVLWPQAIALGPALPHVEQYQVVWPRRLPGPRTRRALPSHGGLYPETVSYVVEARGHAFTLHLRKNRDLLGSGYTETYSAADGSEVTEQIPRQGHCLYQGHVEGHQGSAASLSTCTGLRGFFQVGSTVHLIEPLDGDGEDGRHMLYQARHLRQEVGTCGVSNTSLSDLLGPRVSKVFRSHPRNWPPPRETRYVEVYMVADSAEVKHFGSREAVRSRVLEVVNHVDRLYQPLNFRVVLVGLEIWKEDKFHVSHYPNVTLENLLSWRAQHLLGRHPHDNVQLITGVDFMGTVVGLAKVSALCSQHSGAVNQDHSRNPFGVASTMAHELGHNLGMDHDENIPGCHCPEPRQGSGCIMAASTSSVFPRVFSKCSQADLETFVEKPQAVCLANAPDPSQLVGGPKCGNLFVERGEQCDCGPPEDCKNSCCNATTCQLADGADCAHGTCCHNCKVKPAGDLCRPLRDECDLEEFCDGRQPACPEDAFQQNGTPCPGGYCFNGSCPTLAKRCQALWGPGSQVAADSCFTYAIPQGCSGPVISLKGGANRCGTLYCKRGQQPLEAGFCRFSSREGMCHALWNSNAGAYEPVPQGTKCEEGKVCWEGRCQDLHVYRSQNCSAQCHNRGVCNHKGECHCQPGWAPPYCAQLLADPQAVATKRAAVRSTIASRAWPGPVGLGLPTTMPSDPLPESWERWSSGSLLVSVLVPMVALVATAVILAGVIIHRRTQSHVQRRGMAAKTTTGLSNPVFCKGGGGVPAEGRTPGPPELVSTTHLSQPSRHAATPKRPPPPPPAATPSPLFTVPVYAQQAPDQQLRPAPPTKPLPALKPKQVKPTSAPPMPPGPLRTCPPSAASASSQVKPTSAPPMPPVKPKTGALMPGTTQRTDGPKVALKPPVQKR